MASYHGEVGERGQDASGHNPVPILKQVERDLKSSTFTSLKHRKLQTELAEWLVSTGKVKSVRAEYGPPGGMGHNYDLYVEWGDGTTEAIEVMRRAAFGNIPYGRRKKESLIDYALRVKGHKGGGDAESKLFAYSAGGADMNSVCVPVETYEFVRSRMEKSGLKLSKIYTFDERSYNNDFKAVLVQP